MRNLAMVSLLLACASTTWGATISKTGTFLADDDVALFSFSVSGPSTVTLRTFSYAGGTNGQGTPIPAGGFDPVVSLFDAAGVFVDLMDDGFGVPADAATGAAYDAELMVLLDTGTYQVALTQFDNVPVGDLLDGFLLSGDPAFTGFFGCSNGQFCDDTGANRTAFYALDLINVDAPTQIPEPGTLLLLGTALGFASWRQSRRYP